MMVSGRSYATSTFGKRTSLVIQQEADHEILEHLEMSGATGSYQHAITAEF
jgi:hypothetical protein